MRRTALGFADEDPVIVAAFVYPVAPSFDVRGPVEKLRMTTGGKLALDAFQFGAQIAQSRKGAYKDEAGVPFDPAKHLEHPHDYEDEVDDRQPGYDLDRLPS